MSDLMIYGTEIHKEKFAMAKNKLKDITFLVNESVNIDKVDNNDFFILDHNVTGKELNKITAQIQKNLIASNKMQSKIIKELSEVYDTVEYLDKEYINSILIALKAAEKVDDELKDEQKKISRIIEGQKETIYGLIDFKKQITEYQNRVDVLEQAIINLENKKSEGNKAMSVAIVAVIGVILESIMIFTMLH